MTVTGVNYFYSIDVETFFGAGSGISSFYEI